MAKGIEIKRESEKAYLLSFEVRYTPNAGGEQKVGHVESWFPKSTVDGETLIPARWIWEKNMPEANRKFEKENNCNYIDSFVCKEA